jgi:hypothetical protein
VGAGATIVAKLADFGAVRPQHFRTSLYESGAVEDGVLAVDDDADHGDETEVEGAERKASTTRVLLGTPQVPVVLATSTCQ